MKMANSAPPERVFVTLDFGNGNQREVGTLFSERVAGQVSAKEEIFFEFAESFLENPLPLSPFYLPPQQGRLGDFRGGGDARIGADKLPGVFNDSLPDGWGKLVFDRLMESRSVNPAAVPLFLRLAYVGKTGMGALTYEPDRSESDEKAGQAFEVKSFAQEAERLLEGESSDILEEIQALNGSSHGARPKAMIGVNEKEKKLCYGALDLPEAYEAWMVKFPSSSEYLKKEAGVVEYLYAQMAQKAGLDMMPTLLLRSGEHPGFFAVKRFDREGEKRLHLHSAAGMLHLDFRTDFLDYRHLMMKTEELTHDRGDVEKLFRQAVFNVLSYNRDDHAKNFSFLMDETGKWRLSPAYDITFCLGAGGYQSLGVMGESADPKIEDLQKLGRAFHLQEARIKEVIEEVSAALSQWRVLAKEYGLKSKTLKEIDSYISRKISGK